MPRWTARRSGGRGRRRRPRLVAGRPSWCCRTTRRAARRGPPGAAAPAPSRWPGRCQGDAVRRQRSPRVRRGPAVGTARRRTRRPRGAPDRRAAQRTGPRPGADVAAPIPSRHRAARRRCAAVAAVPPTPEPTASPGRAGRADQAADAARWRLRRGHRLQRPDTRRRRRWPWPAQRAPCPPPAPGRLSSECTVCPAMSDQYATSAEYAVCARRGNRA